MTWLLLAAGLAVAAGLGLAGAVCLPGTRWRAGLDPRARARWVAAGLAGAVALTYAGLALLAVPAVAAVQAITTQVIHPAPEVEPGHARRGQRRQVP